MSAGPEQPIRSLSEEEIETFDRDGVICLRRVIPSRWLDLIAAAIDRSKAEPSETGKMLSKPDPGYLNDLFLWLHDDAYRRFIFESPCLASGPTGDVL
jgi:hypothetical protein